jgi:hypothetical protein
MCGCDRGRECDIADDEFPDPMRDGHPEHRGILGDLGGHLRQDRLGTGMRLIEEVSDAAPAVVIADDAGERDHGPGGGVSDGGLVLGD